MNLTAIIPSGQTEITVNGLHQWDYGRLLEIRSSSLPATVEVHFACSGMDEAVVRVCESSQVEGSDVKVVTAAIPDLCLEQTTPIVAWVYELNSSGSSGQTTVTIKLPIMARPKPAPRSSVPTTVSDQYTQLLAAVNTHVDNLREGNVIAGEAVKATQDGDGNVIKDTYLHKEGTAKYAEMAAIAGYTDATGYAATAGAAESADLLSYTLSHTMEIVNGEYKLTTDDILILSRGALYLAIFETVDSEGKDIAYSAVFYYPNAGGAETHIGIYTLGIMYSQIVSINKDGTNPNGTLKLYKIAVEKEG